jgi:hypothetical protein
MRRLDELHLQLPYYGARASKTFSDAQEANAEGQEWRH